MENRNSIENLLLKQHELKQKIQFQDIECKNYSEIFRKIDALMSSDDTIIVAIDGNCASGKSTLSALLENAYDCNIFHMDDFFLRPELRTKERYNEAGGNVDYVRFKQEVITGLKSCRKFQYQIFDCSKMALAQYVQVMPKKLNIIEGAYSMHPTLIDNYNLKIFLSIDEGKQKERILKRNGPIKLKRFIGEWIPMENRYFSEMKIKEKCDLVISV